MGQVCLRGTQMSRYIRIVISLLVGVVVVATSDTHVAVAEEPVKQASISALIAALKDENENVRNAAAQALGEIGTKQAVSSLVATLQDKNEYAFVRSDAALALGRIGVD